MEGAGSPVELNLMDRDLVNLRPVRHLDGRWILVGDIDRGGIYAQLAGTWALLPEADRARGLGAIVNRFRRDLSLFPDPQDWLAPHAPGFDVLGTLPYRRDLQPEEEDGLREEDADRGTGNLMAWVRLPHAANLTDCQPWWDDAGVRVRWTDDAAVLAQASVIVVPGSKNTVADLRWLHESGLAEVVRAGRINHWSLWWLSDVGTTGGGRRRSRRRSGRVGWRGPAARPDPFRGGQDRATGAGRM